MAKFDRYISTTYSFKDKLMYKVSGPLTEEDINKINSMNQEVILMLRSTKGQDKELLRRLNDKVTFSVVGGLDYTKKQKFNDDHYIERTLHSPQELAKIIEYFEKIERHIRYTWTDTQKCMYVYKTLAQNLHYKYDHERDIEDGKDVVRSLSGLLYGKLVCSGFALVFKEAMDRIGIPCIYQNVQSHHSWNIVELEGAKRAIELTWECYGKGPDNELSYGYFNLSRDFYNNKHHNITNEKEEQIQNIVPFSVEKLTKDLIAISYNGNIRKIEIEKKKDMYYEKILQDEKCAQYFVYLDNKLQLLTAPPNRDDVLNKDLVEYCLKRRNGLLDVDASVSKKVVEYTRDDGSNFFIAQPKTKVNDMEYYYFDGYVKDDKVILRRGVILSETNLLDVPEYEKSTVANYLLSKERLLRKMNYYNGYVGYIGNYNNIYYDRNFEKNNLHIPSHDK